MCMRLCKRSGERDVYRYGSKIDVFSAYGEWENEYERVMML